MLRAQLAIQHQKYKCSAYAAPLTAAAEKEEVVRKAEWHRSYGRWQNCNPTNPQKVRPQKVGADEPQV